LNNSRVTKTIGFSLAYDIKKIVLAKGLFLKIFDVTLINKKQPRRSKRLNIKLKYFSVQFLSSEFFYKI